MSEFFAEATVRLRPDVGGFVSELRTQLKSAIEAVETTKPPVVRVRPALTKDFVGDLRKQANAAITQANNNLKPLRVRVVVATPPIEIARSIQQAQRLV